MEILTLRLIATECFFLFVCSSNNFYTFDFAVFAFCAYYLWLIYTLVTHLDFLYFCFVDQDSAHDCSPNCRPNNPRHNLKRNGRGRGRRRGRGLAGVGCEARQQDPPIPWSRNYILPADRPFAEPLPGPAHRYPCDSREGTFFDAMFTDDMWELVVTETNYVWRCHENLVPIAWYDRRSVYLFSTIHPPESIGEPTTVQRCSAGGATQPIPPPQLQLTRNLWMELIWQTRFSRAFWSYRSPTKSGKSSSIVSCKCLSQIPSPF